MQSELQKYGEERLDIKWTIENFQFCWHKTGEGLRSPVFTVNYSVPTFWRLWLYPRGDVDGEHISVYVIRESGGPETLSLHPEFVIYCNGIKLTTSKYPRRLLVTKIGLKLGFKRFALRSEIFAAKPDNTPLVLTLICIITKVKSLELGFSQIMKTRIEMASIYSTEIFDHPPDLDPGCTKDIEIKSTLEEKPLLNLNFSYAKENLLMKISPISCSEIKYAMLKITVLKNWGKESPIEHVRSWISEVTAEAWSCHLPFPEPNFKTSVCKAFSVHYDFSFSTGEIEDGPSLHREMLSFSFQDLLSAKPKTTATVLGALEATFRSQSFVDFYVRTKTKRFPAHKAILWVRCPKIRSWIDSGSPDMYYDHSDDHIVEGLLSYLYTDTVTGLSFPKVYSYYNYNNSLGVERLATECRNYCRRRINGFTATCILHHAIFYRDISLRTAVETYIKKHGESILKLEGQLPECLKELQCCKNQNIEVGTLRRI